MLMTKPSFYFPSEVVFVEQRLDKGTIAMNIDLNKRLKEKQYQMMKEHNNISFSGLVNQVLEEGLKHSQTI